MWALYLLSLALRGMAILLFVLGFLFMCVASVTPIVIPVASIGVIGFIQISYLLICGGWFFGCLVLYAMGQFIMLMMQIEENTYFSAKYAKIRREAMFEPPPKRKNIKDIFSSREREL